jgi:hypothetical protein
MTKTIPQRQHKKLVLGLFIRLSFGLGIVLACFFPYCSGYINPSEENYLVNISGLWFVPISMFFGILFGIVIERMIRVARADGPDKDVPISRLVKLGKFLSGWKGAVFFVLMVALHITCDIIRPEYYQSVIFGKVPGLSQKLHLSVRNSIAWYFNIHPNPKAIPSLLDVINEKNLDKGLGMHAVGAIGATGDNSIDLLEKIFNESPYYFIRYSAVADLKAMSDKRVLPILFACYANAKHRVTSKILERFFQFRMPESFPQPKNMPAGLLKNTLYKKQMNWYNRNRSRLERNWEGWKILENSD